MSSQKCVLVDKEVKIKSKTFEEVVAELQRLKANRNKMLKNRSKHKETFDLMIKSAKSPKNSRGRQGGAQKRGKPQLDADRVSKVYATIIRLTEKIDAESDAIVEMYDLIVSAYGKENKDLMILDKRHNGPNTPSSNGTVMGKQRKQMRSGSTTPSTRKPGGQHGHPGANKGEKIKIDATEKCTLDGCTCCGSKNIQIIGETTEIRKEIPQRPKAVTTKYIIPIYVCGDCIKSKCICDGKVDAGKVDAGKVDAGKVDAGKVDAGKVDAGKVDAGRNSQTKINCSDTAWDAQKIFQMTAHVGIPRDGMFGVNVLADVLAHHIDRLPNRKTVRALMRNGIPMSNGTVSHILDRFGHYVYPEADRIRERIRRCHILCIDEMTIRYRKKEYWLWVFYDPLTGTAYYIIRDRSGSVPREVLGPDWEGIIVCDGWTAYNGYDIQRCWAHIIREMEALLLKNPDSSEADTALKTLRKIFHDAKEILKKPKHVRVEYAKKLHARVLRLLRKYADDPVVGEFMPKLGRALPNLFKFVLDPRIPPTNNFAEQHLREPVIVRSIRGCIRSEKALDRMPDLLTCVKTWENYGLDPIEEIKKHIPMI